MNVHRHALEQISRLRPAGDVNTCKNPRKLVEQMETLALAALTPPVTVAATDQAEDQADRDRRMYEQGRKDALSGEPEAFI